MRIFIFFMFFLFSVPAYANNNEFIQKIEEYLNSIQTLQSQFQQYVPGETYSSGVFYYKKPRQFLWQYNIPHEQKIISTGTRTFFHDPETGQTTQLPNNSGFAVLLNQNPIKIQNKNLFSIDNIQEVDNVIALTLKTKSEEESTSFTLRFTTKPMKLISISQSNNFGTGLNISFSSHRLNKPINSDIFNFTPEVEKTDE